MSALTGDDQWHISFKIPSLNAFSEWSIDSIHTGIITKAVQTEVVQIANHTKCPSPDQYTYICSKLVKAYPTLKDDAGNGYVSIILIIITLVLLQDFSGNKIFNIHMYIFVSC